jgi:hypothetical protein
MHPLSLYLALLPQTTQSLRCLKKDHRARRSELGRKPAVNLVSENQQNICFNRRGTSAALRHTLQHAQATPNLWSEENRSVTITSDGNRYFMSGLPQCD